MNQPQQSVPFSVLLTQFEQWMAEAASHPEIKEPTAMSLATADKHAAPSVRIVLLKSASEEGFLFYTNMNSKKSQALKENPQAALNFYWMPLDRQVRIEGSVARVDDAVADQYFAGRVREKQIGAWASEQSHPMASRDALENAIAHYNAEFADKSVPRPPYWSGWLVKPERIEFWQQRDFRLHERVLFTRQADGFWQNMLLYP